MAKMKRIPQIVIRSGFTPDGLEKAEEHAISSVEEIISLVRSPAGARKFRPLLEKVGMTPTQVWVERSCTGDTFCILWGGNGKWSYTLVGPKGCIS